MSITGVETRAGLRLLLSRSGQCDKFSGNLHLWQVGALGNFGQLTALKIHSRVCGRRILAQNAIESNQWLQEIFPASLANVSKAANTDPDSIGALEIGCHFGSTSGNLFQQNQLQRRNQRP